MARKTQIPVGNLIPASDILSHIKKVEVNAAEHERHMHQIAISCFAIAARDGQISPLNRFAGVLREHVASALKAYALIHCKGWLTMKDGEYRVKPETPDARHDFLQAAEMLLDGSFIERTERPEGERNPKPLTEPIVLKKVNGLLKKIESAPDRDIQDDVITLIRTFRDRLAGLLARHASAARGRGRPRKEVAAALPPKRRGRPTGSRTGTAKQQPNQRRARIAKAS